MKILAQYNRSLEDSEEEWVLVEILGHEIVIMTESGFRGDEYDLDSYTLDEMGNTYPKTLGLLMKNKSERAISEEWAKEKKSQEDFEREVGR